MKIALLLCGQYRTLLDSKVLSYQNKFISKYNVDVFITTWDDPGISLWDIHQKKDNIYSEIIVNESEISKIKNLREFKIFNFQKFVNNIEEIEFKNKLNNYIELSKSNKMKKYNPIDYLTSYPQLFTIYEANKLKELYEKKNSFKYDIVIKSRPDFLFFQNIDLIFNLFQKDKNLVVTMNAINEYFPFRIFDVMFVSSTDNMDLLSKTFLEFKELSRLSFLDNFKLKIGNKVAKKIESFKFFKYLSYSLKNKLIKHLKGLEATDACRLLFKKSKKEKLKIYELDYKIGDVIKREHLEDKSFKLHKKIVM